MKILMLGTGSMISLSNPACYLVNNNILVDMPNGMFLHLKRHNLNHDIKYVVITHMHADHVFDMPFLLYDKLKRNEEINIIISRKNYRKLKRLVKLGFPRMYYKIFLSKNIKFINNKNIINIDDIAIESFKVKHGKMKESYGYFFKENGTCVCFTGDTSFIDKILNCSYLICDCTMNVGNENHMGVDNILKILNNKEITVIPSHMGINSKEKLKNIKCDNLKILEDMEEINI